MATKKAAAAKGTAKRTPKGSKTVTADTTPATQTNEANYVDLVESEADTTATTATDKDLQEGAISDVVTETAETPVVKLEAKSETESKLPVIEKVYRCKVTHHHASGPKHHYPATVKTQGPISQALYGNPETLAALEASAVTAVNAEHNLDLVHGAENVTVEPTLVDFYFVEG